MVTNDVHCQATIRHWTPCCTVECWWRLHSFDDVVRQSSVRVTLVLITGRIWKTKPLTIQSFTNLFVFNFIEFTLDAFIFCPIHLIIISKYTCFISVIIIVYVSGLSTVEISWSLLTIWCQEKCLQKLKQSHMPNLIHETGKS